MSLSTKQCIEAVARAAHESCRTWCDLTGDTPLPAWADAPQWQKDAAIKGVEFAIDNPNATPGACHDQWVDQKVKDGWVYGEVKDAEKKTHPCIKPYEDLSFDQRWKDSVFMGAVDAMVFGMSERA